MASKGYLFNRRGLLLEEIQTNFRCGWTINGVDTCIFRYPTRDLKHEEYIFEYGNFLVVIKGRGLPNWVGRMEPRRDWRTDETQHSALSTLNIFNQRIGKHLPIRSISAPAGGIFQELVGEANMEADTLIRMDDVFMEGKHCTTQITPISFLMKNLERLFRQSQHEVYFEPKIENNRLTILAKWKPRLGQILEHGLNERNCDPDETPLSEEGPIYNLILGIGAERDDGTRAYHWARNQASIDKHDVRVMPLMIQSDDQNAVEVMTEAELLRLAWPRKVFKAFVSNADDTYQSLRLGNIMPFDSSKIGFRGVTTQVRLYGMVHDDTQDDGVETTLKEYV